MKTCTKCGETKPLTEFYKKSSAKDGYHGTCKECKREYCKQYHQKNKEAIYERQLRWRQENKEIIAKHNKRYYEENKEVHNENSRQYHEKKNSEQSGCVYQIVNTANQRMYIGQTTRGELRWSQHLYGLRRNYHENPSLQSDFNEFGEDVFGWSIIQELPKDKEVLVQEEKNTIQRLLAEGKELYNIILN